LRQVSELVHEAFETVGTGLETLPALGLELIGRATLKRAGSHIRSSIY